MKKQRIHIEHELTSNSENIIWNLIATAEGLARWMADDVQQSGDTLAFTWGELWSHHEIREAYITDKVRNHYLRFRWKDEEDDAAYIELRMEKSDLTGDYTLAITDFAPAEDTDQMRDLWEDNLEQLHRSSGL